MFASHALSQLQADSWVALVASILVSLLSSIAHHFWIYPPLLLAAWGVGYFVTDRAIFPKWIRHARVNGLRGLPWQSRYLLIVAVGVFCYFLLTLFVPLLPGEGRMRLIDGVIVGLFGVVAAAVWAFRVDAARAKRVFELSGR
jgi:hypothetical protein